MIVNYAQRRSEMMLYLWCVLVAASLLSSVNALLDFVV